MCEYACICGCMYMYMYVCMHACVYVYVCMCMCLCMCLCMRVSLCTCVYVYTYFVCVCVSFLDSLWQFLFSGYVHLQLWKVASSTSISASKCWWCGTQQCVLFPIVRSVFKDLHMYTVNVIWHDLQDHDFHSVELIDLCFITLYVIFYTQYLT